MDMSALLNILSTTQNAVLPSPTAMRVALHLSWAIVLGSGALLMTGKLSPPYRLGLALLVMSWTLVPGSASPAYWLGLAFQIPSLTSAVICLAWLFAVVRGEQGSGVSTANKQIDALKVLAGMGVILGWALLFDTLAWLPVSVYSWGFGSAAFGAVAVMATLPWVMLGTAGGNRVVPGLLGPLLMLCVLILFVLTRLPTGNVWDALIDPWLWIGLQASWLISAARRLIARKRSSLAIRA